MTPARYRRTRFATWLLVVVSCGALVGTSATSPARVEHQASGASTGAKVIAIHITESGVDEATAASIVINITAEATPNEVATKHSPVKAIVTFDQPGLERTELSLRVDPKAKSLVGSVPANIWPGCAKADDDDTACDIKATVTLVPARANQLSVSATLVNRSGSFPFGTPSLSKDARIVVSVP